MSGNSPMQPKAAALRGAVFAFSPTQDQGLRQPLRPTVNGAKRAATLAAEYGSMSSLSPRGNALAKSEDTIESSDASVSVRNQIQRLERSSADMKFEGGHKAEDRERPVIPRSSSHIAARLASAKPASNTQSAKRSSSVPRAPANAQHPLKPKPVNLGASKAPLKDGPDDPVWPAVEAEPVVKPLDGASSLPPTPPALLSPQSTGTANIAAKAAAASRQSRASSTSSPPRAFQPYSLLRRPSPLSTQSDLALLDSIKDPIPLPPKKPDLLRPRSTSQPRKSSRHSEQASPVRDLRSGLTTSHLADAIVASSLASSRAPSPTKASIAPPPPPRRQRHSHSGSLVSSRTRWLFPPQHPSEQQQLAGMSASTSPSPGPAALASHSLRTTLRHRPSSSSDEDSSRRGRRHLVRKHPHKHHEGSRQRWRPAMTASERRRYEGVWAANRGLWMPADFGQRVCNLVVRDVWKRSGLGEVVLGDIWDLVSGNGDGAGDEQANDSNGQQGEGEWRKTLGKKEFVVGTWLVDQSLKGRKLPGRLGNEVWESARGVEGVKVKGMG